MKAEACFLNAEFETSLLHFHRAQALRPGVKVYREGVKKAQRAIENSVGGKAQAVLGKVQTVLGQNANIAWGLKAPASLISYIMIVFNKVRL